MTADAARALLARLLRQRGELGAPPFFLKGLGRDQALRLAARAGVAGPGEDPDAARGAAHRSAAAPPAADGASSLVRGQPMPVLPAGHEPLRVLVSGCRRCALAEGRTQVVFHDGVPQARLMVIGEAPGKTEDETGLPFVGAGGKLLDLLLMTIDLSRKESVYICNVLKCRPPGNRNPLPDEIEACRPFLERQIEIVAPKAILGVGIFAAQWLTGSQTPLGKLRGEVYSYREVPLVVTYHPAALLRNAGWTRATWDDFQLLRQVLGPDA